MAPAPVRVAVFIDGFNLYHAIDRLRKPHLKWVDLRKLMQVFIDPARHELTQVYYFSAFATWLPQPLARHQHYVAALRATGVTPVIGHFKEKDRQCLKCGAKWTGHEEKETDVNIALYMLRGAFNNEFDAAYLVSRDSDLIPALRMIRSERPEKFLKVIAPPNLRHSKELGKIVGDKGLASIKEIHLERSLLPAVVIDPQTGNQVATRPAEYAPRN